jgi:hypothetical protein
LAGWFVALNSLHPREAARVGARRGSQPMATLDDIRDGYELFGARRDGVLKVAVVP